MADEQQDQTEQRDADQTDQHDASHDTEELGDKGREALRREREARKAAEKERADLAKRIAQFEADQKARDEDAAKAKGEWEKVAKTREDELNALKAQLAARDLKDRKAAIARKVGLPDDLIDRLQGEDDETLEADAKALAKLFAREDGPDTDSGKRSTSTKTPTKDTSLLTTYKFGTRR